MMPAGVTHALVLHHLAPQIQPNTLNHISGADGMGGHPSAYGRHSLDHERNQQQWIPAAAQLSQQAGPQHRPHQPPSHLSEADELLEAAASSRDALMFELLDSPAQSLKAPLGGQNRPGHPLRDPLEDGGGLEPPAASRSTGYLDYSSWGNHSSPGGLLQQQQQQHGLYSIGAKQEPLGGKLGSSFEPRPGALGSRQHLG